jgi:hypothetical protein
VKKVQLEEYRNQYTEYSIAKKPDGNNLTMSEISFAGPPWLNPKRTTDNP